jgi:hypothetical protein
MELGEAMAAHIVTIALRDGRGEHWDSEKQAIVWRLYSENTY